MFEKKEVKKDEKSEVKGKCPKCGKDDCKCSGKEKAEAAVMKRQGK